MDFYNLSGVWVGAMFTLMALSFLYKENPLSRFAEHVLVGLGVGYFAVWGVKNVNDIALTGLQAGDYSYVIPLLLGVFFLLRVQRKHAWLSRWPIAVIVGVSTALFIRGSIDTMFLGQITAAATSLATPNILDSLTNLLLIVFTVCTIMYFVYSREHKGPLGKAAKIGRYAMMISFGAIFAGAVVTRVALMAGVIQFLLFDWLGMH